MASIEKVADAGVPLQLLDLRDKLPEKLSFAASEFALAKDFQFSDESNDGPSTQLEHDERAIVEGAKACETLLRTRHPCAELPRTRQCPFPRNTNAPTNMTMTEQTRKAEEPQRCPFSGKLVGSKDVEFEQCGGSGQDMKERLIKLPDMEDDMSRRGDGSKLTNGMCSLCPLAKIPPHERVKQQTECPLQFDSQGNIIRHRQAAGSVANSVPKCPIRFLDHHSPEEVAKYFEEHKREIPRSHEICIKRYQTNSESIKKLDAKYGSLVNMIEGLGAKHQPFLPDTEEEARSTGGTRNNANIVAHWASEIIDEDVTNSAAPELDHPRQSHFDRPLKDVRVGESPSRPWGISVPVADDVSTGDAQEQRPNKNEERHGDTRLMGEGLNHSASIVRTPDATYQHTHEGPASRVIFNGPVFIGYPPDKAAAFLKQLGLSGQLSLP